MSKGRKFSHLRKTTLICREVAHRETYGKRTSIYAIAKGMGFTPNGSFSSSVWQCVDDGFLDARPVSHGKRFSWQLTLTKKGWERAR